VPIDARVLYFHRVSQDGVISRVSGDFEFDLRVERRE